MLTQSLLSIYVVLIAHYSLDSAYAYITLYYTYGRTDEYKNVTIQLGHSHLSDLIICIRIVVVMSPILKIMNGNSCAILFIVKLYLENPVNFGKPIKCSHVKLGVKGLA